MSFLRLKIKSVSANIHASSTATTSASTTTETPQWALDEFNSQRAEHDRRFRKLLDECGAVHQERRQRFLALLQTVRVSFDAAQEKRQEYWRAMQKDLRDFNIQLQESSSARSEAARDAAANEGLASCERRAQHQFTVLCGAYTLAKAALLEGNCGNDITLLERRLIMRRLQQSEPIDLFLGLERELRRILEKHSATYLTRAAVSTTLLPVEHETARRPADASESPASGDHKEGYDRGSSGTPITFPPPSEEGAKFLAAAQQEGSLISPTMLDHTASHDEWPWMLPNSLPPGDYFSEPLRTVQPEGSAKPASPLEGEFRRAQAVREEIWELHIKECYDASGWREKAFSDLQAELEAEFLRHPCMKGGREDAATTATTAAFDFRVAEARRDMAFRRLWRDHVRSLMDKLELESLEHFQGSGLTPVIAGTVHSKTNGDDACDSYYSRRMPTVFTLRDFLRRPDIPGALPVSPKTQPQRSDFDQRQRERETEFATCQSSRRRSHSIRTCSWLFDATLSGLEARAAQAERERNLEFARTLERVRAVCQVDIVRSYGELALTLEKSFSEAQQSREDEFHDAVTALSAEMRAACEEFRRRVAASAAKMGADKQQQAKSPSHDESPSVL